MCCTTTMKMTTFVLTDERCQVPSIPSDVTGLLHPVTVNPISHDVPASTSDTPCITSLSSSSSTSPSASQCSSSLPGAPAPLPLRSCLASTSSFTEVFQSGHHLSLPKRISSRSHSHLEQHLHDTSTDLVPSNLPLPVPLSALDRRRRMAGRGVEGAVSHFTSSIKRRLGASFKEHRSRFSSFRARERTGQVGGVVEAGVIKQLSADGGGTKHLGVAGVNRILRRCSSTGSPVTVASKCKRSGAFPTEAICGRPLSYGARAATIDLESTGEFYANSNLRSPAATSLYSGFVYSCDDITPDRNDLRPPSPSTAAAGGWGSGGAGQWRHRSSSRRRRLDADSVRTSVSTTAALLREQLSSLFQLSDNKLAMKLYGNRSRLMKEKMRMKTSRHWVIHPCSNFRFYWDLVMLILLLSNVIILPVSISFYNENMSRDWLIFNGLSDTFFLADLVINFRTGVLVKNYADEIILDPVEIARQYLKSWFVLDFISSIPFDYVIVLASPDTGARQLMHAGRALRMFRLVKLLSLLRLLRLSRLMRYVSQWEEFLNVAGMFMRIFNLICMMLLIGHWNGCLQFLVPMLQDFPENTWVAINNLQSAPVLEQYTWSLFKALSHMLSIGYGRYPPQCISDTWLTIISMVTGATFYALFVGHSTTLIQSFDTSRRLYAEKRKQVEEYMISRKLPSKLCHRITDYYEHRFQGKMFNENSILGELNECLKEEIIKFNCRVLVASVPFFTYADASFVTDVVTKLQHEVFQPNDYVIREGSVGTKMYFIQEGIVDIVTKVEEVVTSLSDGSYFGEISLLFNVRRVASVRAETYCNLFSLSAEHFLTVLDRYPAVRVSMETVAKERQQRLAQGGKTAAAAAASVRRRKSTASCGVGGRTGADTDDQPGANRSRLSLIRKFSKRKWSSVKYHRRPMSESAEIVVE